MVSAYFFAIFQNHLTLYPLPRVISEKNDFSKKISALALYGMKQMCQMNQIYRKQ